LKSRFAQFVSVFTSAAVLLCGIVCAGGGTALAADDEPCHETVHAEKPCCHAKNDEHEKTPPRPAPCHEHSCGHCHAAVTASSDSGKGLHPAQAAPVAAPALADAISGHDWITPVARRNITGDPSPPAARTLLSLHCALNT
jgi:hypothetical protein